MLQCVTQPVSTGNYKHQFLVYVVTSHMSCLFSDCPLQMSNLPAITGSASCHITSLCTGIYCCIEDDGITSRSYQTYVNIDPCKFKMTVGIEKLTFSVLLFDYEQGKEEKLYLFGVVRVK